MFNQYFSKLNLDTIFIYIQTIIIYEYILYVLSPKLRIIWEVYSFVYKSVENSSILSTLLPFPLPSFFLPCLLVLLFNDLFFANQ